jgi:hypothetical protein
MGGHKVTTNHLGRTLASGWVTFLIALALSSPLIYWSVDRGEPVTVHRYELFPKEVRPGQKVLRQIEVTRNKRCYTDVSVLLFDGERVRWIIDEPPIEAPGPLHVRDSYSQPMVIPRDAAPGPAELRITTRRICNPLQNLWPLVTHSQPIYFTILPPT